MCTYYTVLKRDVISFFLKMSSELSGEHESTGKMFHAAGPLTNKL